MVNMTIEQFQSSFELTGYITRGNIMVTGKITVTFQSSFELTGYITSIHKPERVINIEGFKALSSLRVI